MASTISSSTTTIPPSWLSDNTNSTALRDASFSSYLDPTEEKYIRTLVTTIRHPPRPPKLVTDDEIDVFRADKYFNGVVGQEIPANNVTSTYHRHEKNIVTSLSKLNIQPRTPSIHSESSWNSRSALVRPMFKSPARGKNNSRVKKSLFFSSCYCCDDKSVDINDDQDQFSNQGNETFSSEFERGIATRTIKTSFDTSDIARFNKKRIDSYNTTEPFTFPVSSGPTSGTHNDTESDASSDLFEIDCLPSTANSAVGPTGYEPSEASVDWSVVTASAADFSVVSDFDEQGSTLTSVTRGRVGPTPKSSMNDGGQKSRTAGGMMIGGCKSQKAVRVAENVYMSSNNNGNRKSGECQRILRFSDSYSSVTKFRTEDKLTVHGLRPSRRISGSDFLYTYICNHRHGSKMKSSILG